MSRGTQLSRNTSIAIVFADFVSPARRRPQRGTEKAPSQKRPPSPDGPRTRNWFYPGSKVCLARANSGFRFDLSVQRIFVVFLICDRPRRVCFSRRCGGGEELGSGGYPSGLRPRPQVCGPRTQPGQVGPGGVAGGPWGDGWSKYAALRRRPRSAKWGGPCRADTSRRNSPKIRPRFDRRRPKFG